MQDQGEKKIPATGSKTGKVVIYEKIDPLTYQISFPPDLSVRPIRLLKEYKDIVDQLESTFEGYTAISKDKFLQKSGKQLEPYGGPKPVTTDFQHIPADRI